MTIITREDTVRKDMVENQARLSELAAAYEAAKKEQRVTGRMRQLLDVVRSFNDTDPPGKAAYVLGRAAVLAEEIEKSSDVVEEFEALEKRVAKQAAILEDQENKSEEKPVRRHLVTGKTLQ